MKKVKFMCFLTATLLVSSSALAQAGPDNVIRDWKEGDQLPDLALSGIKNYPKSILHLSDLKDKLLILDFWNIHCGSCIEAFPHLKEIQEKYKGKLQIILVNYEKEDQVNAFFKKRERLTGLYEKLPMINGDSILVREFKHEYVPHEVWIYDGHVRGFTALSKDLNDSNILAAVHGSNVYSSLEPIMAGKNTPHSHLPLFVNGNGGNGSGIMYMSVLSKYVPDAVSTYNLEGTEYKTVSNESIKVLYQIAYNDDGQDLSDNRTILDVKDSTKYMGRWNTVEDSDRLYTYQLYGPRTTREKFFAMMRADLDRYFGLHVHFEKRKMLAYVLTAEDSSLLVKPPMPYRWGDRYAHDLGIYFQNAPVGDLLGWIRRVSRNFYLSKYPLIDHTGIKGNIEVILDADLSNPQSLDRALYEKYKMHLKLEEALVDVLIIRE
jgi:thiol-disulfide isomerase/thioredoxin